MNHAPESAGPLLIAGVSQTLLPVAGVREDRSCGSALTVTGLVSCTDLQTSSAGALSCNNARSDTSVTGPVLKLLAAKPEAVLIAGSGTPAALPQKTLKERGYAGKIFQTHGVANNDFLRVGGKDVDGTILPAGPVLVAAQLPDANPVKKAGLEYVSKYEAMYGAGSSSTFGAHANDALALLQAAIPVAAKTAKPGTAEFRSALRDALEGLKDIVYSQGVVTMTAQDHVGQDNRARVMVTVENGAWKLLPDMPTQ